MIRRFAIDVLVALPAVVVAAALLTVGMEGYALLEQRARGR